MKQLALVALLCGGCASGPPLATYWTVGPHGLQRNWEDDDGMHHQKAAWCEPSAPCVPAGDVRFSFITDTQLDPEVAGAFAERVRRARPAFVLHGGDLVQFGGSDGQWRELLRALSPFTNASPLIAAVGNHEYALDKKGRNLARYLGYESVEHTWFSHREGPVEVFVLNSVVVTDDELNVRQQAWLKGALEDSDAPWKIALFHHPVFSRGMMHIGFYPKQEYRTLRRDYMPLFEGLGVELVLSGHTHLYERSVKDGVHYLVGGPAGGPLGIFGGKNPHMVRAVSRATVTHFEASERELRIRTEDLRGRHLERFTLRKPPANPR